MFIRLKRLAATITKLIDTAHEAAAWRRGDGLLYEVKIACDANRAQIEKLKVELADVFEVSVKAIRERDAIAHKLDWLTRERTGRCPFPPNRRVLSKTRGSGSAYTCEAGDVLEDDTWRPENLDLYKEFRDA